MRKIFCAAFIIALILSLAGISCANENEKNIQAWDIEKMIHPELKKDFSKSDKLIITPENINDVREFFAKLRSFPPKDSAVDIDDEVLNKDFALRVYTPKGKHNKKLPGLLWIHGGGHVLGSPEENDELMIEIVKRAKCIVVQPDYSLAPEYPYPADLNQCMEALKWLANNSQVDANKIAVAGISAGGGLTAALTLKARDEGGPKICFQMPLYPMLDYRNITPSSYQMQDNRSWCRELNITAWKMYLGDKKPDIYAQKLMQAGVPVELHVIPRVTHGFEVIYPDANISKKARDEYINALANALK